MVAGVSRRRAGTLAALLVFYVAATALLRRRGYSGLGRRCSVRCRDGHLFRTIWIPGLSVKAIRLGWWRFQYCPVGRHWSVVSPQPDVVVEDAQAHGVTLVDDLALP